MRGGALTCGRIMVYFESRFDYTRVETESHVIYENENAASETAAFPLQAFSASDIVLDGAVEWCENEKHQVQAIGGRRRRKRGNGK